MKDSSPVLIIIILFVLLGLAYSPLKNSTTSSRTSRIENKTSNNSAISPTDPNFGYTQNKNVAEEIKEAEKAIKKLEEELKDKSSEEKRSPYYNKVKMSRISGVRSNDPSKEYISLSTNLDKTQTVNITGWYLKSEVTGYYAMIGRATILPFPFTKADSDIVLQQKDRVYLVKGFSPIGISFRTNKCTGYFEENRTFTPRLPLQCPRPSTEDLPQFSTIYDREDECINLIKRIPRCTTKGNEYIRELPDTVTNSCKTYIKTQINYNSCVAKHFDDTDFPGNEYRVYLGKFGPLWRAKNEILNLHDKNGLIVDTISF